MKKIYRYMGLFIIMIFSFYYTDKIALIAQKSNPIMKEIEQVKKEKEVNPVNAVIDNEKIIPGKNGLSINTSKSFSLMKSFGAFNSYYLVYEQIKPNIKLEDNKEKIIYQGNPSNKQISIIIENDKELISYLEKYKVNILKDNKYEFINNKDVCYVYDISIENICKKMNKYLIKTNLILTNNNVVDIKNKIESGSIILVKKNTSIEMVQLILSQAKFKGLNIVYLNDLISEENTNS